MTFWLTEKTTVWFAFASINFALSLSRLNSFFWHDLLNFIESFSRTINLSSLIASFLPFLYSLKTIQIRKANDDERGDSNTPIVRVTRATPTLPQGVTDDTPDFSRDQVMLDIPDELFGNSFTMVTNISKLFGDWLMVCISFFLFVSFTLGRKGPFSPFLECNCYSYYKWMCLFMFSELGSSLLTLRTIFQTSAWSSFDRERIVSTTTNYNNHWSYQHTWCSKRIGLASAKNTFYLNIYLS